MMPDHGSYDNALGLIVALAICGVGVLAFLISRANGARRSFSSGRRQDELALETLRGVVDAQRAHTMTWFAACAAGSLALVALGMAVLLPLAAAFVGVGIGRVRRLQRLAALTDADVTRVVSDGHFLFAAKDRVLLGWVAASPAVVARATRVPLARVRRTRQHRA